MPPNQDFKSSGKPIGKLWKDRRRECAAVLYRAMDITWEDKRLEVQPRLETLSFLMRLMWRLYVRTRPSVWRELGTLVCMHKH